MPEPPKSPIPNRPEPPQRTTGTRTCCTGRNHLEPHWNLRNHGSQKNIKRILETTPEVNEPPEPVEDLQNEAPWNLYQVCDLASAAEEHYHATVLLQYKVISSKKIILAHFSLEVS